MFCRNNSYCKYESIHQGEMKQSAVSSVFRKLVGAFQNYFMLFMCPIIKLVLVWNFYPPAWPSIVNRWLLRSIRIARIARIARRQQWHDLANHDITLNRRKKKNSKTKQKKKWRDEEKRKKICSEHLQSFVSRFLARARERFARNGYVLAHPSSRGNYFLLRVFLSLLVVFSIAKLLEPSLAFACSIMAFSRNESSRIFVEHARHFARIQFRTQAINCAWYKRLSYKNQLNN